MSDFITKIVLGPEFLNTSTNVKIMSSVILFGGLNYLFGIIGLVNLDKMREFAFAVLTAGFLCVSITGIFCRKYFDNAAALGMLVSEIVLFIIIFLNLLKIIKTKQLNSQ